jgi:LysR family transcriptional regulator, low CO2-responsive transcriptional regulator
MDEIEPTARSMAERGLRFVQVRAFNAVVVHGNFSEAARALGLTQPAITAQIRSLEELAGSRLFHRGAAQSQLTELGRALVGPLRSLHHTLADAEDQLTASRELRRGILSIGICGPYLVLPLLGKFVRDHPGVRVTTRFGNSHELIESVREHRLDLATVTLTAPAPELFNLLLATQHLVLAAPRDHPLAPLGRIRLELLQQEAVIIREVGSMTRQVFEDGLSRAGVSIAPAWEFGTREAVKEAAACGLGLGIVLDREFGHDSRLVKLTIEDASFTAGEYLISPPSLAELGAVRAFIEVARTMSEALS